MSNKDTIQLKEAILASGNDKTSFENLVPFISTTVDFSDPDLLAAIAGTGKDAKDLEPGAIAQKIDSLTKDLESQNLLTEKQVDQIKAAVQTLNDPEEGKKLADQLNKVEVNKEQTQDKVANQEAEKVSNEEQIRSDNIGKIENKEKPIVGEKTQALVEQRASQQKEVTARSA